jgi:WD40 repeat protein
LHAKIIRARKIQRNNNGTTRLDLSTRPGVVTVGGMFAFRRFLCLSAFAISLSAAYAASEKLSELRGAFRTALNRDASRVVVSDREGTVSIWELPAGTRVTGDLGPNPESTGFVMSGDTKLAVIGFKDGHSRIFDTGTAKAVSPPLDTPLKAEYQMPALFCPDNNALLLFTEKDAVVFETHSGKRLATIPSPTGTNEDASASAIFTADGTQCFIMDGAGTVTRYETKEWKASGKPMRHPRTESAYDFYFSASSDGKWLATFDGSGENGPKGQLQIWDVAANKPVGKPLVAVNGLAAKFFGSNRVVILPGRGEATVRELPSLKTLFALRPHDEVDGPSAEVSPDGKWLLSWGPDQWLNLYDVATGKLANNSHGPAAISKIMMAPDSSGVYVLFDNSAFMIQGYYDNYVVKFGFPELNLTESLRSLDFILGAAISADGRRLMVQQGGSEEERLLFFDAATLKPIE